MNIYVFLLILLFSLSGCSGVGTVEQNGHVSTQYNEISTNYVKNNDKYQIQTRENFYKVLDTLDLAGKRILDLGCGHGKDFEYLSNKGASVYGIDSSSTMVTLTKNSYKEVNVKLATFDKLPFDNDFFDVVISKYALQTTYDLDLAYKEVSRVLKPKGKFVVLVTCPIRQFHEKKKGNKNYFDQQIVYSSIYDGNISIKEPSHMVQDYLSIFFLNKFTLKRYQEVYDPTAGNEKSDGSIYPTYIILESIKN